MSALVKKYVRLPKTKLGTCSKCGKSFSFEGVLYAHKMIEHGDLPPHHCTICETAFFSTQVYSVHLVNHCLDKQAEEKTEFINCCICGLDYHSSHSLRIHITTHVGIASNHRPLSHKSSFMCHYCPSIFKTEAEQKEHEAEHNSQSMPFQCDLCPMTFRVARQLSFHKQRHRELSILPKEAQEKYFQQVPFGGIDTARQGPITAPENSFVESKP